MDGIEIQKLLPWPHDGTVKDGDARFSIIVLMTVYMTFSPATGSSGQNADAQNARSTCRGW